MNKKEGLNKKKSRKVLIGNDLGMSKYGTPAEDVGRSELLGGVGGDKSEKNLSTAENLESLRTRD